MRDFFVFGQTSAGNNWVKGYIAHPPPVLLHKGRVARQFAAQDLLHAHPGFATRHPRFCYTPPPVLLHKGRVARQFAAQDLLHAHPGFATQEVCSGWVWAVVLPKYIGKHEGFATQGVCSKTGGGV